MSAPVLETATVSSGDAVAGLVHGDLQTGRVVHRFFTRSGGTSHGIYSGLNCGPGSDDAPAAVAENRRRATAQLGPPTPTLLTLHQVHSASVVTIGADDVLWSGSDRPRADAMVTDRPDVALGILTADCGPILLADSEAGVIGAAHSGWKGSLEDIGTATVLAMEALGASRSKIVAVLGPCIGAASYEVGPEFPHRFVERDPAWSCFFTPAVRPDHFLFDLPGFILDRLKGLGLASVASLGCDTYSDPDRFYSFRRATHRGERDYGRLLSAIRLQPSP